MNERAITQPQKIASPANTPGLAGLLQRKCACGESAGLRGRCIECDEERLTLQRRATDQSALSAVPPIVDEVLRSPAKSLDDDTRALMESRFGHDFSRVRVHTDAKAAESARAVNALAYTIGHDVVFGAGQYAPHTSEAKRLLAHELTHVMQQSVATDTGVLRLDKPDSAQERAAERTSDRALSGQPLEIRITAAAVGLQRQPAPGEPGPSTHSSCRIHFVQGRPEFTDASEFKHCMEIIRGYLKGGRLGSRTVELHGFASEEGSEEFNQELSQRRADIVKLLLGRGRIPRSRIKTFAHGRDRTYATLEENRRVEVVLAEEVGIPEEKIPPYTPELPEPKEPEEPPGPEIPPDRPSLFCKPYTLSEDPGRQHMVVRSLMMKFTEKFGGDVQDLWRTYLDTPKTGTKGTLPPRRLFGDQESRVVKEFREDPVTLERRSRIIELIAERVRKDPTLMPAEGETTEFLPFRHKVADGQVLADEEIMDLPMEFKNPFNRIPGLIAGGPGKNASDAGDDVRNVDGRFRVTNQGGGTFRVQVSYVFDILDAIDFCPGAAGEGWFAPLITVPLSRLEATPDIPTYDTPFEVIVGAFNDRVIG